MLVDRPAARRTNGPPIAEHFVAPSLLWRRARSRRLRLEACSRRPRPAAPRPRSRRNRQSPGSPRRRRSTDAVLSGGRMPTRCDDGSRFIALPASDHWCSLSSTSGPPALRAFRQAAQANGVPVERRCVAVHIGGFLAPRVVHGMGIHAVLQVSGSNGCDLAASNPSHHLAFIWSVGLDDARRLPRALAGRQDGRRFGLRPIQAHHEVDRAIRRGQPVVFLGYAG